jgi:transcription initiation factor TFIIB
MEIDALFDILDSELKKDSNEIVKNIPSNICIECESESLTTDYANGMIVCQACGIVQEESIIDESPEWNFGQEDAMFGKDPSRCGCPINPLLEKSSMSTMIGKGGGAKFWLLRKIHQQNSMDYVERARYHTFENIQKLCDKGNLPASIVNKAKFYYKELSTRKLSRGNVRQGLIACCIMYACKSHKVSRSVKEIADMCDIDSVKINSAVKIFTDVMNDLINDECSESTQASDLISRFCNCINLSPQEQFNINKTVRIYNIAVEKSKILIGKTPSAVTSALIFYILKEKGYNINKKSLCENHKISIVTLNKIVQILENNKSIFENVVVS